MKREKRLFLIFCLIGLSLVILSLSSRQALALQGDKKLTVERLYSTELPSLSGTLPRSIQWMPDGKQFIYLMKDKTDDKNKLWLFDVATGKRKIMLTADQLQKSYQKLAISEEEKKAEFGIPRYILSPDGKSLLFSYRGDLYFYIFAKQHLRRLTATSEREQNPAFSPDGRYIAYTRDDNLYALEVDSSLEIQLTTDGGGVIRNGYLSWVYFEELYGRSYRGFWWSPDSQYIAFYQFDESPVFTMTMVDHIPFEPEAILQRYPKAGEVNPLVKLGIVNLSTKKTIWVDANKEEEKYIARAIWLPDSSTLSLQVLNRLQNRLELLFVNPQTGEKRLVLKEEQPCWVDVKGDIYFFKKSKHLLWPSDESGWRHLYLYDLEGNLIRQLTDGNWEARRVVRVDETRELVYFMASEKSSLERHLYRVKLDGTGFQRLTQEVGSHSINMPLAAGCYIDTYSNCTTPSRMDLFDSEGVKLFTIEENRVEELADYKLSTPEFLTVTTSDGLQLPAMMIKPPDFNPKKKYPVLFSIYGGPASQRVSNSWGGTNGLWHQMLAQNGIIVFSLDNRASTHFGKEGANKIYRRLGHWEVLDLIDGVKYLRQLPYVNSDRIGIWGWSYGGYMTCMAMFNAADYFQVGVSVAPVTHWRDYDTIYTERYMGLPQENPEGYKEGSPLTHVDKLKGKLLLVHGTLDDNVHFQNAVQLAYELIKAGKQFDLMIYPRKDHGIYGDNARPHLFTMITDFLLSNLK